MWGGSNWAPNSCAWELVEMLDIAMDNSIPCTERKCINKSQSQNIVGMANSALICAEVRG